MSASSSAAPGRNLAAYVFLPPLHPIRTYRDTATARNGSPVRARVGADGILDAIAAITVTALHTTPVKGLRVVAREAVELGADGVVDDRRFYLVDERARMVNGKVVAALHGIVATYDHGARELALAFPDGNEVAGPVALGDELQTSFFSRPTPARELQGAFAAALSEHAGRGLRLVEPVHRRALDRGRHGAVSLVSRASLQALAGLAGESEIDARRFRMLVELDGLAEAHEEDTWVGREVRVGAALVRVRGHVGRCLTTQRHPESGETDLPTLDLLRSYRGGLDTSEPLAFGVYGEVREPGRVAVGDAVSPT